MKRFIIAIGVLLITQMSFIPALASTNATQLDGIAAIVNKGVITNSELHQQMSVVEQQIKSSKMTPPSQAVLRKRVLQHLIDVDLQLQMAKQMGITVNNQQVTQAVAKIAQKNGISVAQLRHRVTKGGLSYKQYLANIKKQMTISQLQEAAVGKGIIITPAQVKQALSQYQSMSESRSIYHVKNILVPLDEAPAPSQVQAAKAKAQAIISRLNKGESFSKIAIAQSSGQSALQGGDLGWRKIMELPDIFAKHIRTMKPGQVAGPIRTPNGFHVIKLVAEKGVNNRHTVTLTHVRHILIKMDAAHTAKSVKHQLERIRAEIENGASFAKLAKRYSQDLGSADKGGDIGWVTSSQLVPNFAREMRHLKVKQISQPTQTQYGWHLIEVLGRRKVDDTKTIQKQQVRMMLFQRKFSTEVANWLQGLRGQAYVKVMPTSA
jgi:peptidyl-prolyl cis-trans isomerase SurA